MRVYRVEHPSSGKGPFNHCVDYEFELDMDRHPCPDFTPKEFVSELNVGLDKSDIVFGLENMMQYHIWFSPEDRKILSEKGYKLLICEIDEIYVKIINQQVLFVKNHAMLLECLDPYSMLECSYEEDIIHEAWKEAA